MILGHFGEATGGALSAEAHCCFRGCPTRGWSKMVAAAANVASGFGCLPLFRGGGGGRA